MSLYVSVCQPAQVMHRHYVTQHTQFVLHSKHDSIKSRQTQATSKPHQYTSI